MCHVDKMSCQKCNYSFAPYAMLQFGVVGCNYFNPGFSKFVCMLGCPSFLSDFCFYNMKPIEMLIFGWECKGWNRCKPIVLFNCVMKFVDHPSSHLPQSFSSLHFVRFLNFSFNLLLPRSTTINVRTSFCPFNVMSLSLGVT
jgi:hypothetical protein